MKPSERCVMIREMVRDIMDMYEDDLKNLGLLKHFKDIVVQMRLLEIEILDSEKARKRKLEK